jgi:hypothetical protein
MTQPTNIVIAGVGGKTVQWTVFGRSCEAAGEPTGSRRKKREVAP